MGIIKDIRGDIEQESNLLLEKYRDALMLEALSLVSGDKHTAEELVLQTFEAHLFKREKYDPSKGELLPWLKGILRNLHGKSQRDRAMRSITYLSPEELEVSWLESRFLMGIFSNRTSGTNLLRSSISVPPSGPTGVHRR